ncbi:MAG: hypothetical protein ACOY0T_38400 [Myxococcota bacterium]
MIDVKEVRRRLAAGQNARQMASEGVVGRGTASRYIAAPISLGLSTSDELTDERVRAVALPAVSDPRQLLETRRIQIEKWPKQDEPPTLVPRAGAPPDQVSQPNSNLTLDRYARASISAGIKPALQRTISAGIKWC